MLKFAIWNGDSVRKGMMETVNMLKKGKTEVRFHGKKTQLEASDYVTHT